MIFFFLYVLVNWHIKHVHSWLSILTSLLSYAAAYYFPMNTAVREYKVNLCILDVLPVK